MAPRALTPPRMRVRRAQVLATAKYTDLSGTVLLDIALGLWLLRTFFSYSNAPTRVERTHSAQTRRRPSMARAVGRLGRGRALATMRPCSRRAAGSDGAVATF